MTKVSFMSYGPKQLILCNMEACKSFPSFFRIADRQRDSFFKDFVADLINETISKFFSKMHFLAISVNDIWLVRIDTTFRAISVPFSHIFDNDIILTLIPFMLI